MSKYRSQGYQDRINDRPNNPPPFGTPENLEYMDGWRAACWDYATIKKDETKNPFDN